MDSKEKLKKLVASFYPFAKKALSLQSDPRLILRTDPTNAVKALGKTAQFDPANGEIVIYVSARHPKDACRSLAHEIVHFAQSERGEFDKEFDTAPGYAQTDEHLRALEKEAYEKGNIIFRDWEDSVKKNKQIEEISADVETGGYRDFDMKKRTSQMGAAAIEEKKKMKGKVTKEQIRQLAEGVLKKLQQEMGVFGKDPADVDPLDPAPPLDSEPSLYDDELGIADEEIPLADPEINPEIDPDDPIPDPQFIDDKVLPPADDDMFVDDEGLPYDDENMGIDDIENYNDSRYFEECNDPKLEEEEESKMSLREWRNASLNKRVMDRLVRGKK